MASSCWARVLSCVRCEPKEIASLRRRLREIKKEADSDGETIRSLTECVASLERAVAAVARQRNAAEALRGKAEQRAEEAEATVEAARTAGELVAKAVWERKEESEGMDPHIEELEREMYRLSGGNRYKKNNGRG